MKRLVLISTFALIGFVAGGNRVGAQATNDPMVLSRLAGYFAPSLRVLMDAGGKPRSIISSTGETLDLAKAEKENPMPTNSLIGYWFTPTMDFLSKQNLEAATPEQAYGIIQLFHAMCQGESNTVRQKIYKARKFEDAWVVDVQHDFKNFPGNIMEIQPYELIVNNSNRVQRLRQRCYHYLGSRRVYTNTVTTVYEREIKRDNGRNYPEKLFDELRDAWEKEKSADESPTKKF